MVMLSHFYRKRFFSIIAAFERCWFMSPHPWYRSPAAETDFIIFVNDTEVNRTTYSYDSSTGVITFSSGHPAAGAVVVVKFIDRALGDYRYIKLKDIVNNFVMGFVGNGKLIPIAWLTSKSCGNICCAPNAII